MGCRGRLVAAALSFYPPSPPYYSFVEDIGERNEQDECNQGKLLMAQTAMTAPQRLRMNLDKRITNLGVSPEVFRLRTRSGNCIAVCIYRAQQALPSQQTLKEKQPQLEQAQRQKSNKVLLYSHGNAADLGSMHEVAVTLSLACKCTVVTYDYSGYGESNGTPSEFETYRDIKAVYDYLTGASASESAPALVADPARDLVLVGESIGSGPVIWLGVRHVAAGIILHAPIASGLRVMTENRLLCCCDIFPNIDRIAHISCPVFIIHGTHDDKVSINHGMRLHNRLSRPAAVFPPWWVEGAGHGNIQSLRTTEYFERIGSFIEFLERDGPRVDSGACGAASRDGSGPGADYVLGAAKDINILSVDGGGTCRRASSAVYPVLV